MDIYLLLSIISIALAILGILIAILAAWWFSPRRKMYSKDLVETFKKEIISEGKCPECGSDFIIQYQQGEHIGKGAINGIFPHNVCEKCGYEWDKYTEEPPDHF